MNKAIVDTDLYSEILRGRNPVVLGNAAAYVRIHGKLTLPAISVMEMIRGLHKKGFHARVAALRAGLDDEEVLPFDRETAELAGRIVAELEAAGTPIGPADPMIAATALQHGLDLVTGNSRHYQYVQQLGYPLVLVNWRN